MPGEVTGPIYEVTGLTAVTLFSDLLERDRIRSGLRVCQVAWRLAVSARKYRELMAGNCYPDFETFDRICQLFGRPQTFARST